MSRPTCRSTHAQATSRSCRLPDATDVHAPRMASPTVRQRLSGTRLACRSLALAAILFAPLIGSTRIHLSTVFDRSIPYAENLDAQIFFVARLPRVLAAALVGSSMALAGVIFQA